MVTMFEPRWMEMRWRTGEPDRVLVLEYRTGDRARAWVPRLETCQIVDSTLLFELPEDRKLFTTAENQRNILAKALADVLIAAGVIRADLHAITGPELLLAAEAFQEWSANHAPDLYGDVQRFNREVVGPEVDRTEHGLNVPPRDELRLGVDLVGEEFCELLEAAGFLDVKWNYTGWPNNSDAVNHEKILDNACDLLYVLFGLLLRLGFTREQYHAAWVEVTRANMAKAGGPMREDGKRLKPDGWTPPDLRPILYPEATL
jgi:Phosphoribosyl-ATP pyrophosphohydrolase